MLAYLFKKGYPICIGISPREDVRPNVTPGTFEDFVLLCHLLDLPRYESDFTVIGTACGTPCC